MEINDVMHKLAAAPDRIQATQLKILALQETMDALDFEMKGIEMTKYQEICNDKTEEGKPKYTNEKLREAEMRNRLNVDTHYMQKQKERYELLRILGEAKIKYQHEVDNFKAMKYLTQAMAVKYRVI